MQKSIVAVRSTTTREAPKRMLRLSRSIKPPASVAHQACYHDALTWAHSSAWLERIPDNYSELTAVLTR